MTRHIKSSSMLCQLEQNDIELGMTTAELEAAIQEGLDSAENEPLVSSEEARAYLAGVRYGLDYPSSK